MARLLAGYDRAHSQDQRLGGDRALMGIVVAMFHDSGYIRQIRKGKAYYEALYAPWPEEEEGGGEGLAVDDRLIG